MQKRITAVVLALLFCMSMCIPAFAADATSDFRSEVVESAIVPGAQPQAVTVLRQLNVDFLEGFTVKVTPAKGTNLKFVGAAWDEDVKLEVYKNGGWWPSKTVTLKDGADPKTYDLITNCNGEEYTLIFTAGAATVVGSVCQTDYV